MWGPTTIYFQTHVYGYSNSEQKQTMAYDWFAVRVRTHKTNIIIFVIQVPQSDSNLLVRYSITVLRAKDYDSKVTIRVFHSILKIGIIFTISNHF